MLRTLTEVTEQTLREIDDEKRLRRVNEVFLLMVMGSQFDHLIQLQMARAGVFCLPADPATIRADEVQKIAPAGIIVSGGPVSADEGLQVFDGRIFELDIPVFGICLGFQMWAHHLGARMHFGSAKREFGVHTASLDVTSKLFAGLEAEVAVLESHGDQVLEDDRLRVIAATDDVRVTAAQCDHLWGVQFHPETSDTRGGLQMFENFCFGICGATGRSQGQNEAQQKIEQLKQQIVGKKVLLALSGGSDSSVVAYLLKHAREAVGADIRGVYIKGIDRPDDEAHVLKYFGSQSWIDVRVVDASERFLEAVHGIASMDGKRAAMIGVYTAVLEEEAFEFEADFIVQGTLYTDRSESGGGYRSGSRKAKIKRHHNTGNNFTVTELTPLDDCVKDTARAIGQSIGVPAELLTRHPFPGPGLLLRIEGPVDAENLAMARQIDGIYIGELHCAGLYEQVWQAGAVVTRSESTYTKGDDAGTGLLVLLWAVNSVDGFTATTAELPKPFLKQVAQLITNSVPGVAAVAEKISGKPPSTIEYG